MSLFQAVSSYEYLAHYTSLSCRDAITDTISINSQFKTMFLLSYKYKYGQVTNVNEPLMPELVS